MFLFEEIKGSDIFMDGNSDLSILFPVIDIVGLNSTAKGVESQVVSQDLLNESKYDSPAMRKEEEDGSNFIRLILDPLGIEYSNEYSDAHWVYRYKISKAAENINRIKQISNNLPY